MDTSETYIKQCAKASEIQSLRKATQKELDYHGKASPHWQPGDFYTCTTGRGRFDGIISEGEDNPPDMFKPVWLPRQDQLQEIVKNAQSGDWLFDLLDGFHDFALGNGIYGTSTHYKFESMEQLWLAFIMKGKYNKVWNGKDWING